MPKSDEEIVRRVREGDLHAYGQLIDRYQQRLTAAARHLVGDLETARDIVQETFIEAYRHLDGLRDAARIGGWLYGILRHRAHAALVRRRSTVSWEEEGAAEWFTAPDPGERIDVPELLSRLPVADREVLAARYLLELDYDEIARLIGATPQNTRVRVCRAKERLRALLARAEEEVGL
ncbi:MAG: RNA polymerase sigma factor [Armatimonadota bacterium]